MSEVIDVRQEFITAKSKENIVAFAGFRFSFAATEKWLDGLLAISSRERDDGSGYITLTFMIDAEGDSEAHQSIADTFRNLKKRGFSSSFGSEFQTMIETGVDFERSQNWFMDSFTFYFDRLKDIKKYHVQGELVPTFERFLPVQIDPVEWLPDGASVPVKDKRKIAGETTVSGLRGFLQSLFGA